MNKKYELLQDDTLELIDDRVIYRIRALRDFSNVKAGSLGGYIEDEYNLSHEGNCWIYDEAMVWGRAIVRNNAQVCGKAQVYDNAIVTDSAQVCENAEVYENAEVCENALVYGNSRIHGEAVIENEVICGLNLYRN